MPWCFGRSGSVRASRMPKSASSAQVVQTFWPVTTHSSPSRTALVASDARSEPAPGSLNSWHHFSSLRTMGGRKRSRWSSVPWLNSAAAALLSPNGFSRVSRKRGEHGLDRAGDVIVDAQPAVLGRPRRHHQTGIGERGIPLPVVIGAADGSQGLSALRCGRTPLCGYRLIDPCRDDRHGVAGAGGFVDGKSRHDPLTALEFCRALFAEGAQALLEILAAAG